MDEKKKGPWAKQKRRSENAFIVIVYCLLIGGVGLVLLMSGMTQKEMYQAFKDDDYLTDDGLPYRDMANATYTYPASDIDELAERGTWALATGAVLSAGAVVVLLVVAWLSPEKKEMHMLICKNAKDLTPEKAKESGWDYCPECGLKLSKLEKD